LCLRLEEEVARSAAASDCARDLGEDRQADRQPEKRDERQGNEDWREAGPWEQHGARRRQPPGCVGETPHMELPLNLQSER
jgi:hypothetical protein